MPDSLDDLNPSDGEPIDTGDVPGVPTTSAFLYADGSTQTFTPDGKTIYIENGLPTAGEWSVNRKGRFVSFWPPSYRSTYELRWLVEEGHTTGVRFDDGRTVSLGRFR